MAPDLEGHHEPGTATNDAAEAGEPAEPAPDEEATDPGEVAPGDVAGAVESPDAESDGESISSEATPVDDLATEVGAIAVPSAAEAEPADFDADDPPPVPALTKFWAITMLALGPILTGYLAIAALLALVTGIASNAQFTTTGVLTAALPSWLAAYQVPVEIFGLELGILPLLPTVGVAVLTVKAAARAAERLELRQPGQAGLVIGVVASTHAVAGLVVAGLVVDAQVTADPLAALYHPALVAVLAATVGVARPCGLLTAITQRADAAAVAGLRVGMLAVVLLLTAGGAVLTFGLLTSITTARDLFPMGAGNAVGMLLLSIGYLPNAMVAATSFIAGPGFSLGTVTVAPLEFHGGRLPGVPLLAAMPEIQAAWWPALFVLPLTVGIVVGRRLRHVDDDPVVRLRAVAVATGVVAVSFLVLAGTAGGRLGHGTFDPVSMRGAALSIALVLWTVVPGAIATWFGGPRPATEQLPGLIDDTPEDEPEEEPDEPDHEPELPGPRDAVEESGEVARD
jgi:hypothetical protein